MTIPFSPIARLDELLRAAAAAVKAMTPIEREEMFRQQRDSWVRGEMSWPKARKKIVNGTIVYESYEDYCND